MSRIHDNLGINTHRTLKWKLGVSILPNLENTARNTKYLCKRFVIENLQSSHTPSAGIKRLIYCFV